MNQNSQLENNKWQLTPQQLDTRCGPEYGEASTIDNTPQWFRYTGKSLSGETEEEMKEKRIAIQEQINLGILKVRKNQKSAPPLAPNDLESTNPKLKKLVKSLNHDPNVLAPHANNKFRPKVLDTRTGKVRKIGPNDQCPCGSGKKFKKCHG